MFAYMYVERGLSWYKELLELSLPDPNQKLNINPRNCVGTVLSLNGHRKYFCMFHAKHREQTKNGVRSFSFLEVQYFVDLNILIGAFFLATEEVQTGEGKERNQRLRSRRIYRIRFVIIGVGSGSVTRRGSVGRFTELVR